MNIDKQQLAARIKVFIDKYAGVSPNYDSTEDPTDKYGTKYTSPDAYALLAVVQAIEADVSIRYPNSEWGSGGYKPYTSKEGMIEHGEIMGQVVNLIVEQKSKNIIWR